MHHKLLIPAALAASLSCLSPLTAAGAEGTSVITEIRGGVLYHDPDIWGGSGNEEGIDFNAEMIFSPSLEIAGGVIRPVAGLSINDQGNTSKIYAAAVYEYAWKNGLFLDLGLGLTLHNGETDDEELSDENNLLGSPVLFRISIEPGVTFRNRHRLSVLFDHVSNGYLADPNEGLDTIGFRYGWRF